MKVKELIDILKMVDGELRIVSYDEKELLGVYVGLDADGDLFALVEVE